MAEDKKVDDSTKNTDAPAVDNATAEKSEREIALDAREVSLNEREANLDAREAALKGTGKKTEPRVGLGFKFEDQDYKFLDSAPDLIRVDGKTLSQKEISEDEEILLHLIGGNSGLIKKIN
jgi:hypothetical protein